MFSLVYYINKEYVMFLVQQNVILVQIIPMMKTYWSQLDLRWIIIHEMKEFSFKYHTGIEEWSAMGNIQCGSVEQS